MARRKHPVRLTRSLASARCTAQSAGSYTPQGHWQLGNEESPFFINYLTHSEEEDRRERGEPGGKRERPAGSPVHSALGDLPMPRTSPTPFDFRKRASYDADQKRLFHSEARRRLLGLAAALGLGRTNMTFGRTRAALPSPAKSPSTLTVFTSRRASRPPAATPASCSAAARAGATTSAAATTPPRWTCCTGPESSPG